ncbi:MAG: M64 family metallopeptidase [Blastocatellia bacterium]
MAIWSMTFGTIAFGQTVVQVVNNGPSANRVDLVILAEGYTSAEQSKFAMDVQQLLPFIFGQEAYLEYRNYFNVFRIDMVSNQSGADHPERNPPVFRDTAFDATYNCQGIQRLICVNTTKVNAAMASLSPNQRDMLLVLVNDTEYGGSGGFVAVASVHSAVVDLVLHEGGHSFGLLADEYGGPPPPACNSAVEPAEVNATRETVRSMIKWNAWIDAGTPIPTPGMTPGVPGLYQGAKYCDAGLYRPTYNSKMRALGVPFEQINVEQLVKRIYNLVSPLESSLPVAGSLTLVQGTGQSFSVVTTTPLTHALTVTWRVDGAVAGAGTAFNLNTAPLSPGPHTVAVEVRDSTGMVRNDPTGLLIETRAWNVTILSATTANLGLAIIDSPDPVTTGSVVTYNLTVSNGGPLAAANVVVTDNLPTGLTFASCDVSGGTGGVCGGSGNSRTISFASLASGASASITLTATVNCSVANGAVISNAATVTSTTSDPDPSNNSATATTTARTLPQISRQPQSLTRCLGQAAAFLVSTIGAGHTFQWRKGGNPIIGETSNVLLISVVGAGDAGTYDVVVTSACGISTTSTAATLTISQNCDLVDLQFYPLPQPIRLLDTRAGFTGCDSPNGQIPGGTSRTQTIAGRTCGGVTIPANARAITGNITTVQSGGGFLTLYPSDATRPLVANSNYGPNEILNNVFTVGLGAGDGAFNIYVTTNTDVVVDVTGYYAPPSTAGLYFHPLPRPVRLLDTRANQAACYTPNAPLPGVTETSQQATGPCAGLTIPANAKAIIGNATTVNPQGPQGSYQFFTLFPSDAARPTVASSNYLAGQVMNGPFTVGLSSTGAFKIYPTTQTELVIDISGYYSPDVVDVNGIGLLFHPLTRPVRLLETRPGFNGCYKTNSQLVAESTRTQPARGVCDSLTIPANAAGIIGNATVVQPLAGGWLTFFPSDAAKPTVAQSNYSAGQVFNRHFIVGLGGADGAFNIFTKATTHLVIDLSGYFAP